MSLLTHPGGIATLHRLAPGRTAALEAELSTLSRERPITLLLPCRAEDLETDALSHVARRLADMEWISRVVVGVDAPRQADADKARALFAPLRQKARFLWTESPAVLVLEQELDNKGLTVADDGRGRHLWLCLGAALAAGDEPGVVLVQSPGMSIVSRGVSARLCWPLLCGGNGFRFVKGARPSHTGHPRARLVRYLVTPLLRTMEMLAGPLPALRFLGAFTDPLGEEMAFDAALAPALSVPAAGGAGIGILEQMRRALPVASICQSELAGEPTPPPPPFSRETPDPALHRLAREITAAIAGLVTGGSFPWQVHVTEMWEAWAHAAARSDAAEAALNGLLNDPDENALFIRALHRALEDALENPRRPALLPSWREVEATVPGGLEALKENAQPA